MVSKSIRELADTGFLTALCKNKRFPIINLSKSYHRPDGVCQVPVITPDGRWKPASKINQGCLKYNGDDWCNDFFDLSTIEKVIELPKMLEPLFSKQFLESESYKKFLDDKSSLLKILTMLELGKSLMCSFRMHFLWQDEDDLFPGLKPFIKFTSNAAHMDLARAQL